MLFDHQRPHAFREWRASSCDADDAIGKALASLDARAARRVGLQAYALHLAHDRTRVMTVEVWRNEQNFRDARYDDGEATLYRWAATGGTDPTPVADPDAGVIIIDRFRVWRPLLRPVSAFNIRNGRAFDREPGCISTTVLRGIGAGSIATYARWSSAAAFAAAFAKITGKPAATPDDVNRAAARMTAGLIRPDYHSYDLIAYEGDLS